VRFSQQPEASVLNDAWFHPDFWRGLIAGKEYLLPLLAGLVALLESVAFVGLLVPGIAILFALAALAGSLQQPLGLLLLCGFIGAAAGDLLSFLLGRYAAEPIKRLPLLQRHPGWIARGERFFARYGGTSIVLGRFVGPVRPIIPFVAGSCDMRLSRFLLYNLLSALAWSPVYLLPGYLTGRSSDWVPILESADAVALALLITLLLLFQQIHMRLHPEAGLWHWLCRHQLEPRSWSVVTMLALSSAAFSLLLTLQLSGILSDANHQLLQQLQSLGTHVPHLARALTDSGDPTLVTLLALICALTGQFYFRQRSGWGIVIGVGLALLLNHLIKETLQVTRPPAGLEQFASYSFPSGHASAASAFYALFSVWLLRGQTHRVRHIGYLLTALAIIAIALSRVMLGVHWPLDVAAGTAEGLAIASLYRFWIQRREPATPPSLRLPLLLCAAALLLFVATRQLLLG